MEGLELGLFIGSVVAVIVKLMPDILRYHVFSPDNCAGPLFKILGLFQRVGHSVERKVPRSAGSPGGVCSFRSEAPAMI